MKAIYQTLLGFLCVLATGAQAQPLLLEYNAFVGNARAGTVSVALERTSQTYTVRGEAESKGLMDKLRDIRAWFSAKGRIREGLPEPDRYEYYQKDKRKERFVTVANGELSYVKNGEQRPNRPALPGIDMVTALWVVADCNALNDVHTGRSRYQFDLLKVDAEACRFRVTEDDEEPFELAIVYGVRDGQRIPVSISSTGLGLWAGSMQLVD